MLFHTKNYLETAVVVRKLKLQPDIEKEILKYIKQYYAISMIHHEYSFIINSRKNNIFQQLMTFERNNCKIIKNKFVLEININNLILSNLLVNACKYRYNDNDNNIDWTRLLAKIYVGLYYSDEDPPYIIDEDHASQIETQYSIIEHAFILLIEKILKIEIDTAERSGFYLYNKKLYNKLIVPFKNTHYIMEW